MSKKHESEIFMVLNELDFVFQTFLRLSIFCETNTLQFHTRFGRKRKKCKITSKNAKINDKKKYTYIKSNIREDA